MTMKLLNCSFCGKNEKQVARLLGGSNANICDDCITSSVKILNQSPEKVSLGDEAILQSLSACDAAVDAARDVLQQRVELLRERGTSWEIIGKALGVSRQSAWERFS